MDPRGRRIPWWSLPPPRLGQGAATAEDSAPGAVLRRPGGPAGAGVTRAAGGVAGKPETPAGGGGEATARKARRGRRRGGMMGEEGVMMA